MITCFYITTSVFIDNLVKMDWRHWASIARLSIRKMCCLNGSRKLLTQKIIRVDVVTRLWTRLFSARSAIFCRYWTCTFSRRNNQAIGAEVVCIFTFFQYLFEKLAAKIRIFQHFSPQLAEKTPFLTKNLIFFHLRCHFFHLSYVI